LQGVLQCRLGIIRAGVTSGFCLSPGLADDTVMGFDHGVGNGAAPFDGADRKDGKAAIT